MHTLQSFLKSKKTIMLRLEGIQRKTHEGYSHAGLRALESNLQLDLHRILCQEELTWFQRIKDKCLADGDKNTCFDHVKVIQRRRRKHIQTVNDAQGKCIHDVIDINNAFKDKFHNLYTTNIEVTD